MSLRVLKSSAGSGKTFALVLDYLKMALKTSGKPSTKNIMALTFTNKAANEMKQRIVATLIEIRETAKPSESLMFDLLLNDPEFGWSEEELRQKAGQLLHQILHDYSHFGVSTIDRFNHKLIRSFAIDLGLNQNFEVEIEPDKLLREAIEMVIDRSMEDKVLLDFLVEFSSSRIEEDKSWRIEEEIFKVARFILNENAYEYLQNLQEYSLSEFKNLKKSAQKEMVLFENKAKELAQKGLGIIENSGVEPKDFYRCFSGGIGSYFKKRNEGNYLHIEGKYLSEILDEGKYYAASKPPAVKTQIDSLMPQLLVLRDQMENFIESEGTRFFLCQAIIKTFYSVGLVNEVFQQFEALKKERNLLPISDFNKLIGNIVSEQEAPFVYERLGNSYRHFLIDEFQDTSRLQWQNLLPLVQDSLAKGNSNLVVGDGKQAIYRWRGGEVIQFVNLPYVRGMEDSSLLAERVQYVKNFVHEEVLDTNYRSLKQVVEFNNTVMSLLVQDKVGIIQDIYKDVEQNSLEKNEGGWVTVDVQDDKNKAEEYREYCLIKTLKHIEKNRELGYAWGDMAILCRSNKDLRYLAEEISQLEIPVISAEALYVTNSPEVRMLITYLKLACNATDSHEQIRLILQLKKIHQLDFDFYSLGKATLANSSAENFVLICKSLGYNFSLEADQNCDIYERIERGVEELQIGGEANSYLLAFMNAVHEYCRNNSPILSQFIQYFESNSDDFKLDMPENIDAVKLLTIHKSKGLEFPVVIFPFADSVLRFDNHLWVNLEGEIEGLKSWLVQPSQELKNTICGPQLEWEENMALLDALNLFYVACTRAVSHLHIVCSNSSRRKFNHHLIPVLASLKEGLQDGGGAVWGEPTQIPKSRQDLSKGTELKSMYSFPERSKLDYAPLQSVEKMNPSNPTIAGEVVHSLLAHVCTTDELEIAIDKARIEYPGNDNFFEGLKKQIGNTLFNSELKYLFEQKSVFNERDFADKNGNIHRPDRVVVMENEVVVLDYKTGEESFKHHEQVMLYKQLVSEVFDKPAKGYLAYFDLNKIVEV